MKIEEMTEEQIIQRMEMIMSEHKNDTPEPGAKWMREMEELQIQLAKVKPVPEVPDDEPIDFVDVQ